MKTIFIIFAIFMGLVSLKAAVSLVPQKAQRSPSSKTNLISLVTEVKQSLRGDSHVLDQLIYLKGEIGHPIRYMLSTPSDGSQRYLSFINTHHDGLIMKVYHTHPVSYARLRPQSFLDIESDLTLRLRNEAIPHKIYQLTKTASRPLGKTSVGQVRVFHVEGLTEKKLIKIIKLLKNPKVRDPSF